MQDYKLVQRGLVGGASITDGTGQVVLQNTSEFMSWLNEFYLAQGYKIHTVNLVRVILEDKPAGLPTIYEYAYHLVKEVEAKAK